MRFWFIVPAAGIGQRMEAKVPKQYLKLLGKTILERTLSGLAKCSSLHQIIVAIHPEDNYFAQVKLPENVLIKTVKGGETRHDSVLNALQSIESKARDDDWVLVHDAARPWVLTSDIESMIERLKNHPVGGILAARVVDTIKQSNLHHQVEKTLNREHIWRALTPQMFRFSLLYSALKSAKEQGQVITDEAQAIEKMGHHLLLIEGDKNNIKITTQDDLAYAEWILRSKENEF